MRKFSPKAGKGTKARNSAWEERLAAKLEEKSIFSTFKTYVMVSVFGDGLRIVRIPNNNIRIATYGDSTFTWIKIEDFCGG